MRVFYDYEKVGIWQADEKDAAAVYGQFPGEIKVKDQLTVDTNNDGVPDAGDGRIDLTNDRKVLGNDVPKAYGGLNNKITLRVLTWHFCSTTDLDL